MSDFCVCMRDVISEIEGSLAFCALMLFLCSSLCLMCSGSSLHVECILPFGMLCLSAWIQIQNPFLTAQSTQIKSVISVPIKDFIHHYPRALFNDIPRVGAHFYDIPGSRRTFTTYPGRGAV